MRSPSPTLMAKRKLLPIAAAEPDKMREVVSPPDIEKLYASSWVFRPSNDRSHGWVMPLGEFTSFAPERTGKDMTP